MFFKVWGNRFAIFFEIVIVVYSALSEDSYKSSLEFMFLFFLIIFVGYYVYMRERRDQLRSMYPEMPFYEIIRQLAQEWNNMDREIKQVRKRELNFHDT
jgi:hypothetical protein